MYTAFNLAVPVHDVTCMGTLKDYFSDAHTVSKTLDPSCYLWVLRRYYTQCYPIRNVNLRKCTRQNQTRERLLSAVKSHCATVKSCMIKQQAIRQLTMLSLSLLWDLLSSFHPTTLRFPHQLRTPEATTKQRDYTWQRNKSPLLFQTWRPLIRGVFSCCFRSVATHWRGAAVNRKARDKFHGQVFTAFPRRCHRSSGALFLSAVCVNKEIRNQTWTYGMVWTRLE